VVDRLCSYIQTGQRLDWSRSKICTSTLHRDISAMPALHMHLCASIVFSKHPSINRRGDDINDNSRNNSRRKR